MPVPRKPFYWRLFKRLWMLELGGEVFRDCSDYGRKQQSNCWSNPLRFNHNDRGQTGPV